MIFDKIEIMYNKYSLPIKIKYSESRKPTFVEFLILSIIYDYPRKNLSLKQILNDDFKIYNIDLFERALKDLIAYKVIELNKTTAGWSTLGIDLEIEKIELNQKVKEQFINEEYIISQYDKTLDVKWVYDPIEDSFDIVKDVEWSRRVQGVKLTNKIKETSISQNFYIKDLIKKNVNEFIELKKEIFGDNAKFSNVTLANGIDLADHKIAQELTESLPCANEVSIELFDNDAFIINTENEKLKIFLKTQKDLAKNIVRDILKSYSDKIKDRFFAKKDFENKKNFLNEPDILSNLIVKSTWNLLLINGRDVLSPDKVLSNKSLINSCQIIVFYNSKSNNKTIEYLGDKIVVYVDSSREALLNDNTLIYIDSENKVNGFALVEKKLESVGATIPVVYSYDQNPKLNLAKVFEDNLERLLLDYEEELKNENLDVSTMMFLFLKRVGLQQKLTDIIKKHLQKDFYAGNNYKKLTEYFASKENDEAYYFIENCLSEIIITMSKDIKDDQILHVLNLYNFKNQKNLFKVLENIHLDKEENMLFLISDILDKNNVDWWKNNTRNCLVTLLGYANKYMTRELFDINKYQSKTWALHAATLNMICTIKKKVFEKNFTSVEKHYKNMLNGVVDLMRSNVKINNQKDYLIKVAENLKDLYKDFYKYKSQELTELDSDLISYKVQVESANFISRLENKIDMLISPEAQKFPIEVKVEWAKHIENKIKEVDKIFKNDESILYEALNLVFGEKKEFDVRFLENYKKRFGGI
ncbi:hypothetical protein SHELI_v1c01480 [Spiroplasma helicoides]|uniref:Uncharacterized protein n=1 Tax=Spiroplasma helicoides TaxID=216938 RepID=A0A1B3SJJ0_9MOLU|nr:hypothetical protein [Spiroplasma helicoides]AOG60103.1 hypothetical protein SHELI_v1c01480 [Spiroplasma helicoides]